MAKALNQMGKRAIKEAVKNREDVLKLRKIFQSIDVEVFDAIAKFPSMRSPHEGLAILEEEVHELRMEVYKQHHLRGNESMRHEAIQVAAMAVRFVRDLL